MPASFTDLKLLFQSAAEAAATAVQPLLGSGDKYAIDLVAVETLRAELNKINMRGTIVVGEGEADESAFLYNGEKIGAGWVFNAGPEVDIAVDPVDGTTNASKNAPNAVCILGVSPAGTMRSIDDVKMQKIIAQPALKECPFDLSHSWEETFKNAANFLKKDVKNLKIMAYSNALYKNFNRDATLFPTFQKLGIDPMQVPNEWPQVVSLCKGELDMIVGVGGAPEAVIAAAAVIEAGGKIIGQLYVDDVTKYPHVDTKSILHTADIISGDEAFYVQAEITPIFPLKFEKVEGLL